MVLPLFLGLLILGAFKASELNQNTSILNAPTCPAVLVCPDGWNFAPYPVCGCTQGNTTPVPTSTPTPTPTSTSTPISEPTPVPLDSVEIHNGDFEDGRPSGNPPYWHEYSSNSQYPDIVYYNSQYDNWEAWLAGWVNIENRLSQDVFIPFNVTGLKLTYDLNVASIIPSQPPRHFFHAIIKDPDGNWHYIDSADNTDDSDYWKKRTITFLIPTSWQNKTVTLIFQGINDNLLGTSFFC